MTSLMNGPQCLISQVSMGCVDISSVPPDITAHALNRLNIVRLCNTSITTRQLEAILRYHVSSAGNNIAMFYYRLYSFIFVSIKTNLILSSVVTEYLTPVIITHFKSFVFCNLKLSAYRVSTKNTIFYFWSFDI